MEWWERVPHYVDAWRRQYETYVKEHGEWIRDVVFDDGDSGEREFAVTVTWEINNWGDTEFWLDAVEVPDKATDFLEEYHRRWVFNEPMDEDAIVDRALDYIAQDVGEVKEEKDVESRDKR